MKWKIGTIVVSVALMLASILLTTPRVASAETVPQMRARIISELKAQFDYALYGNPPCKQECIDGYIHNGGDWLVPAAEFIGQPLNDVVLADIAWNAKKGNEFASLMQSSHGREPTQAEWLVFWGNLGGYEYRNQGFLDLFNVSPRLDKSIDDNSFRRKQEYRNGVE